MGFTVSEINGNFGRKSLKKIPHLRAFNVPTNNLQGGPTKVKPTYIFVSKI